MFTKFKGINKIDLNHYNNIKIQNINGDENELDSYIKAGEIHKKIRYDIQQVLKPGVSIYDISQLINNKIRF